MLHPPSLYPSLTCSNCLINIKKNDWLCIMGELKGSHFGRNDIIYKELGKIYCKKCFDSLGLSMGNE